MPEEINRVLTDHVANFLFCPTEQAVKNLKNEGIGIKSASGHKRVSSSGRDKGKTQLSKKLKLATHEATNLRTHSIYEVPPRVAMVGDVMLDAAMYYRKYARKPQGELPKKFILSTVHRAENTDDDERLRIDSHGA